MIHSLLFSLCLAVCTLPEALPDRGGVSFNFARMSALRHASNHTGSAKQEKHPSSAPQLNVSFCDHLDGIFALSESQVGELRFALSIHNVTNVQTCLELPSNVGLVALAPSHALLAPLTATDRSSRHGVGRIFVAGELLSDENVVTGRFEAASKPIHFAVLPEIRTARPKRYANGSFCGNAFDFDDSHAVERLARFYADAGVSWLIPPAATNYPALDAWRRNGIRIVTPDAGGHCANGYQLGDGKVPPSDLFRLAAPLEREFEWLSDRSVCPSAVIGRSDYCKSVVEEVIVRHLTGGVDGLWANWEPYMYYAKGCVCEKCGRAFADFLGRTWHSIRADWPKCAFPGGRFADRGKAFRSHLHGRMMRVLDACVRRATGGTRSFGLVPGIHFEQMLSGWRNSPLMAESRPIDFADDFRWINLWGPYLPWHSHLPYEEERGRYVGPWLVAYDLRHAVDRDYPAGRRPKILSAPQGTCADWLTEPENFEMLFDAAFFNRLEACAPWTFPAGADARYWRAFANATGRAAKYEDIVLDGADVRSNVFLRTVSEYASPVKKALRNMPWATDLSQLLFNAYEKDGVRIVALFNCWQKGEAFVSLRLSGLPDGEYEIVSDDGVLRAPSREKTTYGARELDYGVSLVVGAARCRVFEIRPARAAGPTRPTKILTEATLRRHYAKRQAALKAAADEDRKISLRDTAGMIRYD